MKGKDSNNNLKLKDMSETTETKETFAETILIMKQSIVNSLSHLEKGYGKRKWAIANDTGIDEEVLTVLLKQLKYDGKIEILMIWSEETGQPNGSGYCLKKNTL